VSPHPRVSDFSSSGPPEAENLQPTVSKEASNPNPNPIFNLAGDSVRILFLGNWVFSLVIEFCLEIGK
jgi:hypothetical protein